MTSMSTRSADDQFADLRSEIERLNKLVQAAPSGKSRSWKRPMALVGAALMTLGLLAGVAGASGTTTNVTFVPLSPAKTILNNVSIAAHKSNSPVVIGGTTTVPSNATTVDVVVSARGAASGTLDFYPAQNVSGQSGQTLTYPGGNMVASTTIQENVGQSGQLTFYNAGAGTAAVAAKIIGYSTQVTAGDINGVGGNAGDVLTNDGAGGASWAPVGQAYSSNSGNYVIFLGGPSYFTPIGTLTVPAGTYAVNVSAEVQASTFGSTYQVSCELTAPDGAYVQQTFTTTTGDAAISENGVISTTGGTITLGCHDYTSGGGATAGAANMTAVKVGTASGATVFAKRVASPTGTLSRFPVK